MKKILIIVCVLFFFAPALVSAQQQDWSFFRDDKVFAIQGSGSSDNNFDHTSLAFEFTYGGMLTNNSEVGIRQGIGYMTGTGGRSGRWNGSTRAYYDYNFNTGPMRPFLGINTGYMYGKNINSSWIAGPQGGIKYFMSPRAFMMALVEYNFAFNSASHIDDAFSSGRFVYSLGLGMKF